MAEILENEKKMERACMVVRLHKNGEVVDFDFSRQISVLEKMVSPVDTMGNEVEEGGKTFPGSIFRQNLNTVNHGGEITTTHKDPWLELLRLLKYVC